VILTAHQPNYLPYLGFFEKISRADVFLLVDNVQFVKRGPFGWIHRNKIRNPQGWQWLSLDCLTKGKYTQNINEVLFKPGSPHLRKHWRAIEVNYQKAPFFEEHAEAFRQIYLEQEWLGLSALSAALIKSILEAFKIDVEIKSTSALNITGKASELIVNMCQKEGADQYLSGVHGRDYLDLELFKEKNIELIFQDYKHPVYKQCWPGEFEPHMSALDLLFNHGPEAKKIMLSGS
jgi:hypothetical protein